MQDAQDNTFPIPQQNNAANSPPGGVPQQPIATPGIQPDPMAPPVPDVPQPAPAPAWQGQTAADVAAIGGQGQITNPGAPDPLPTFQSTPAINPNPAGDLPMAPAPASPLPIGQTPIAPPPAMPVPGDIQNPGIVPPENTLDLSSAPQAPEPVPMPAPSPIAQPGQLQPGVDVTPTAAPGFDATGIDPNLAGLPSDFGAGGNLGAPPPSGGKIPKKFIIIGAAALGIILVLGLVVVLAGRNSRTPAVELNQTEVEQAQTADDTPESTTTPAEIPDGYKKVERDCFSFGILLPTTINFTPTQCKIGAKFGSVSQYDISVTPITTAVTNLQALVDQAKTGTIESQDDIKLNGVDAKKIVQKVNGLDQQTIAVIPANKNYQFEGQAVNGFIITTSYNDDTAKKASETLISTWTWK